MQALRQRFLSGKPSTRSDISLSVILRNDLFSLWCFYLAELQSATKMAAFCCDRKTTSLFICPCKDWKSIFLMIALFYWNVPCGYVEYSPSSRRIFIEKIPRLFAQNCFHICLPLMCRTFVERFQIPSQNMKRFLIVILLVYLMFERASPIGSSVIINIFHTFLLN